jgi:exopolysaccharide biosynthesis polyprenyl glycosylphosphotransferase
LNILNPVTNDTSRAHASQLHSVPSMARWEEPRSVELDPVTETLRREQLYRRSLAGADAVVAVLAVLLAAVLESAHVTWWTLGIAPVAVVIAKVQGLYDRDARLIHKSTLAEWRSVLQFSAITAIAIYLAWVVMTTSQSRGGMRLFMFLTAAVWLGTLVGRTLARQLATATTQPERCLVLGDAEKSAPIAARLDHVKGIEYIGTVPQRRISGSISEMDALVRATHAHRLVIVQSAGDDDNKMLEMIRAAKALGVRVSLMPTVMQAVGGFATFDDLDGITLLGVPRFGLSRSDAALKRTFDVVGASVAMVLAAPLMAFLAVLIRLDSPGPALFRQVRVGRGGRPFKILKFRSMVDGADGLKDQLRDRNEAGDGLFKIKEDPRVTRVGGLMRRTHLDELPQLLNVVRGEMSLVGPRPLVRDEDVLVVGTDRSRLRLTPGITGPWQVRGPLSTPLDDMAKLDYKYVSNWNLWLDVEILVQTAARVVTRSGH